MKKIKILFWKCKWFFSNYKKINTSILLVENKFLGPITFLADSLATSNNADFLKEPRFIKAYSLAEKTSPWNGFEMQWRTYIMCTLAEMVKHLPGDFVECGVNTGAYSRAIIDYIDFNKCRKTFYLFDTFEGLCRDQISDDEMNAGIGGYLNNYDNVYEQVLETFKSFNTKIIQGRVPDTLSSFQSNEVCFLSIDMNVVEPEIAAANFFWDKLVKGGVMVLDDYGFPGHINQKKAFDQFASEKAVQILYLPTAQGIIFKP